MNIRLTISLPDDLLDALDHQLVGRDETRSSVIRRLIQEALREAEERREVERYIRGYQADPQTVEELGWADQVAPAGLSVEPWG
jgi:Arc/MetJ-type ribon-helix-helix transcriptional regulator